MEKELLTRSQRAQAKSEKLRHEYQQYYSLGYRSDLIITHLAVKHLMAKWTVRDKLGSVIELQKNTPLKCNLSNVSIDII